MLNSMDDYLLFRNQILRFTTGANIHEVNGLLGRIMNQISLRDYAAQRNEQGRVEEYTTLIEDNIKELRKLTPEARV